MKPKLIRERLYLGVDIGGTKILASLVAESGTILGRQRQSTPRPASGCPSGPEQILASVESLMKAVLAEANLETTDLTAIGVAVPGVVEPKSGNVVVTPNMGLTGVAVGAHLESCFHVPVVIGNDGNLGAYGEAWLGSARKAHSAWGYGWAPASGPASYRRARCGGAHARRPARSGTSSCRSAARSAAAAITAAWRPWPAAPPSSATSAQRWPPAARAS